MSRSEVDQIMAELRDFKKEFIKHRDEVMPLLEALRFIQTLQRFLKWGGISLAAALGFFYWVIRKL